MIRSSKGLGDPKIFSTAMTYLSRSDPKLAKIIKHYGQLAFKPHGEMFESIVESIIGQQLAWPAAEAIIKRLRAIYKGGRLLPNSLYSTPVGKLRSAGVSPQKVRYIKDLSSRVVKGKLDLELLKKKSEDEIVTALDEVLGVGPWTVHMLLIFTLGRLDVLPFDDLGIRKGIQRLYSLRELPERDEIKVLAAKWHPYCSVASLYFWRYKDAKS